MRATVIAGLTMLMVAMLAGTPAGSGPSPDRIAAVSSDPVLEIAQSLDGLEISLNAGVGGALEVLMREATPNAATLRFPLVEGQVLTFAMPEQIETLYTFKRTAFQVSVTAQSIEILEMASAD